MFATYRHGDFGVHVDRAVRDPEQVCPHSWASVKISVYVVWPHKHRSDDSQLFHRCFHYQRLLVSVLKQEVKDRAVVAGWNGIRQRVFIRVYQGRGSKEDHTRFLAVEKIAHRLSKLSVKSLKAKLKEPHSELP